MYYNNGALSLRFPGNVKIYELPDSSSTPPISEEDYKSVQEAFDQVKKERQPYEPTEEQLEEYPWLKNAENGLSKIDDIIYDYEHGINDGSYTYDNTINNTIESSNHSMTIDLNEHAQFLSWDDENYSKAGQSSYSLTFKDINNNKENTNLSIDLGTLAGEDSTVNDNYSNFINKLQDNEEYKKSFTSSVEAYYENNDTEGLKTFIKNEMENSSQEIYSVNNTSTTTSNKTDSNTSKFIKKEDKLDQTSEVINNDNEKSIEKNSEIDVDDSTNLNTIEKEYLTHTIDDVIAEFFGKEDIMQTSLKQTIKYLDNSNDVESTYSVDFRYKITNDKEIHLNIDLGTKRGVETDINSNYSNFEDILENNERFKDILSYKVDSYLKKEDTEGLTNYIKELITNPSKLSNEANATFSAYV